MALATSQGYVVGNRLLYPHQYENVVRFVRELRTYDADGIRHGLLVGDVPGLGKTMSAVVAAAAARAETKRRCVVIVVPKSLVSHWVEELQIMCPSWEVFVWSAFTAVDRECFDEQRIDAIIITHSELRGAFSRKFDKVQLEAFQQAAEKVTDRYTCKGQRGPLFNGTFAATIVDESHVFRNDGTIGHAAVATLMLCSAGRLCLTGTPHNNLMTDVTSQMCLMNGREEFRSSRAFSRTSGSFMTKFHRTSFISHGKELVDLPLVNGGAGYVARRRLRMRVHECGVRLLLTCLLLRCRPETRMVPMNPEDLGAARDTARICAGVMCDFKYGRVNYAMVLAQLMVIRRVAISRHMVLSSEDAQDDTEGGANDKVCRLCWAPFKETLFI